MWIVLHGNGVQIRENDISRIWIKTLKARGRGKPKFKLVVTERLTGCERELLEFDNYTKASEALYTIVTALDERRARLELD